MELILLVIYVAIGYWAAGVLFYENKIIIAPEGKIRNARIAYGLFFGWILIPLAILKRVFFRRR